MVLGNDDHGGGDNGNGNGNCQDLDHFIKTTAASPWPR
jgi:hypothetical protein